MSIDTIFVGQGIAKNCIVGDRQMNRYAIFNGLERPRRIDSNLNVTLLGFDLPTIISATSVATTGSLVIGQHYSYRAVFGSTSYQRPTSVLDATLNYTRGNPSTIATAQIANHPVARGSVSVVIAGTSVAGITHVFLYRSLGASTAAAAEAGPFYYVAMTAATSGNMTIVDGLADSSVGIQVETDNFPPNSYRYAVAAFGYLFAGGNFPIGDGYTVTLTPGSSTVTADGPAFYDGVRSWTFKAKLDTTGGVDGVGSYYANYVSATELQLVDANGVAKLYDGGLNGAGHEFSVFLAGNVLRWCKLHEPEAWPAINAINFEGEIAGIGVLPNSSLLVVYTDTPSVWVLDMTLTGTASFKTTKKLISSERTVSSHYSLKGVDGVLRGIDAHHGAIIDTDGVSVVDVSKFSVPKIFTKLSNSENHIKNWHCAYDAKQHLFGAFVTLIGAHRLIDFCIGQNTITGSWFFNFEKDLLCTGDYIDPITGEAMVLGGTQGIDGAGGAVWGRIWTPGVYDDWIPSGYLRSGTVVSSTGTVITVDNTDDDLYTANGGLAGRWAMLTDSNGESAQIVHILSNTANTITVNSVINSPDPNQLSPIPVVGWKFYLGLIEMRWGPKRFDFGDADNSKHILEVLLVMENYNTSDLPFIRLYKGMSLGYTKQNALVESKHRSGTATDGLISRHDTNFMEESPRMGIAVLDRSYSETKLSNLTIVFHRIGGENERK